MGGGSWKVAFADFMTAMFALFLLLWLVNLKPETKEGVANYFKTYSIFKSFSGVMKGMGFIMPNPPKKDPKTREQEKEGVNKKSLSKPDNQKVMTELKDKVTVELKEKADQVLIKEVNGKILIELIDKENRPIFNSGSFVLTEAGRNLLETISKVIIENNYKVAIEGHTDSKKFSSAYYTNWDLSTERALATKRALEKLGLKEENVVSVAGYADTRPLIKDNPEDLRNRRISLLLDWWDKKPNVEEINSTHLQESTLPKENTQDKKVIEETNHH